MNLVCTATGTPITATERRTLLVMPHGRLATRPLPSLHRRRLRAFPVDLGRARQPPQRLRREHALARAHGLDRRTTTKRRRSAHMWLPNMVVDGLADAAEQFMHLPGNH